MLALLVLVWRWPAEWSGLVPLDVFPVALHTFTEFAAIVAALADGRIAKAHADLGVTFQPPER